MPTLGADFQNAMYTQSACPHSQSATFSPTTKAYKIPKLRRDPSPASSYANNQSLLSDPFLILGTYIRHAVAFDDISRYSKLRLFKRQRF